MIKGQYRLLMTSAPSVNIRNRQFTRPCTTWLFAPIILPPGGIMDTKIEQWQEIIGQWRVSGLS
jgi:hypothetical protein